MVFFKRLLFFNRWNELTNLNGKTIQNNGDMLGIREKRSILSLLYFWNI